MSDNMTIVQRFKAWKATGMVISMKPEDVAAIADAMEDFEKESLMALKKAYLYSEAAKKDKRLSRRYTLVNFALLALILLAIWVI